MNGILNLTEKQQEWLLYNVVPLIQDSLDTNNFNNVFGLSKFQYKNLLIKILKLPCNNHNYYKFNSYDLNEFNTITQKNKNEGENDNRARTI